MFAIVVHGGAGGTSSVAERGCQRAAEIGVGFLRGSGSALEAAVHAVVDMENSGIFNAGLGAILRIDGLTIQMDAVVATSDSLFGAVGAVENVRNPVLLAAQVARLPNKFMTGPGATELARQLGLAPHPGPTARVKKRFESMRKALERGDIAAVAPGWTSETLERFWGLHSSNGSTDEENKPETDTVGAAALDDSGMFADASSTGGAGPMPKGRIGDVPMRGAGWQVGPLGAVLATGVGEEIMKREGSGRVYALLAQGVSPQRACEQAVDDFPREIPVGFIALTKGDVGIHSNYPRASHAITSWRRQGSER